MSWTKRSGIMLAKPLEERRLTDPKFGWSFPVLCQPKLDGERCSAENHSGQTILVTSEENLFQSVPHINDALEGLHEMELDGELYRHGMPFSEIHSRVSRTVNLHPDYQSIQYHIFDIKDETEDNAERLFNLHKWYDEAGIDKDIVKLVKTRICHTYQDVIDSYDYLLTEGYEGIIVRHMGAYYVRQRSGFILKFKPKKKDTYRIVRCIEAMDKFGSPKGMLGALLCAGRDGGEFKVGGGRLSHQRRTALWEERDFLSSRWCEVQYQSINEKGVPRFGLAVDVIEGDSMYGLS